ncbi:hypothetical protein EH32_10500 [Erythrobacter litoralis]|uniref:Uncharacterized protein n=1 Tax=Erythrobacter litoralis TaxID=39960 RepID=A0A074MXW4_9SPHN|nr:hypothetical protein EH32_10500 [Erythrobacter litoralis]
MPFTFIGTEVLGDDLRLNTLDRNVLNTLYNLIDLYLIASRSEGGPHALFEACASKCKIISSRVGASEDVLEPYAIFDTDHEAAELINLDHKQNVLAKSLDRNLQIVRDGYSVAAVSQFLPQFYSQVLEAHHSEEADLTGAEFSENLPLPASLRVVRRDQTKSHQAVAVPNGDRNEDLSDKIRNVEALFEANPNDIKLIKELVDHYEAAGRLNSALSAISLAVLTDDVNQQLQYRRSLLLGKLGRRTEALEIALELVKCQPSNSQFQRHLSNLLLHCERIDEALEAAGNAAILDPFNASNYFHFARLLFDSGKVAEAIVAAEQASRADPIDHRIYNLIAEAAEHHGDLEKAKRALAVAHKLAPRGTSYEARLKNLEATEVPSL